MDITYHDLKDDRFDAIIREYITYVDEGIPKTDAPRKEVLIVGAGIAGLVAGSLLKQEGHKVRIIEASHRVGGRIKTFRDEFTGNLYAEAGAMRLPDHHQLLQAYIRKLGLPRRPFFNVSIDPSTLNTLEPKKTFNTYIYVNGVKVRLSEYIASKGEVLNFPLGPQERGKTAQELLDAAIAPLVEFINADPSNHWPVIMNRFGEYSVRRFFKEQTLYSETAIELIGLLLNLESRMMTSFLQSFIEFANINANVKYWEIPGGSDLLPQAFLPELKDNTTFNTRMTKLEWGEKGRGATVYTRNESDGSTAKFTGDEVIVTIPFSGLRFVEIDPLFSHNKRKAIRELHYDAATKVLLEFNQRFWELDDGIYGGGTVTDLANRFIYYPSHNIGSDEGGVVLASYTWGDDALRWDSLTPDERYRYALDGVSAIHGEHIRQYYIQGATQSWLEDNYAYGEAAIFAPGQLEHLHPHIAGSEGNVHFAGEHTSLKHAWIEGAMDSGIRTALEVNENA